MQNIHNQEQPTTTNTGGRNWFRLASQAPLAVEVPPPPAAAAGPTLPQPSRPILRISSFLPAVRMPDLAPPPPAPETPATRVTPPPPAPSVSALALPPFSALEPRLQPRVGTFRGEVRGPTQPSPYPPPKKADKHSVVAGGIPPTTAASATRKKKSPEDEAESGMRVLTIAGENGGAYMDLGGTWKNGAQPGRYLRHHPSTEPPLTLEGGRHPLAPGKDGNKSDEDTAKEILTTGTRKSMAMAKPMVALVNSNVQGVNNSIMFDSSCTHKSPGIHITRASGAKPR